MFGLNNSLTFVYDSQNLKKNRTLDIYAQILLKSSKLIHKEVTQTVGIVNIQG